MQQFGVNRQVVHPCRNSRSFAGGIWRSRRFFCSALLSTFPEMSPLSFFAWRFTACSACLPAGFFTVDLLFFWAGRSRHCCEDLLAGRFDTVSRPVAFSPSDSSGSTSAFKASKALDTLSPDSLSFFCLEKTSFSTSSNLAAEESSKARGGIAGLAVSRTDRPALLDAFCSDTGGFKICKPDSPEDVELPVLLRSTVAANTVKACPTTSAEDDAPAEESSVCARPGCAEKTWLYEAGSWHWKVTAHTSSCRERLH